MSWLRTIAIGPMAPPECLERGAQSHLYTASRRWCDVSQDRTGIAHGLVGQVFSAHEYQPVALTDIEAVAQTGAEGGVAVGTGLVGGFAVLRGRVLHVDPRLPAIPFPEQTAVQA